MIPVITVDGPSGSGKGTIAQRVAQSLGWHFASIVARSIWALGLYAEQQGDWIGGGRCVGCAG